MWYNCQRVNSLTYACFLDIFGENLVLENMHTRYSKLASTCFTDKKILKYFRIVIFHFDLGIGKL